LSALGEGIFFVRHGPVRGLPEQVFLGPVQIVLQKEKKCQDSLVFDTYAQHETERRTHLLLPDDASWSSYPKPSYAFGRTQPVVLHQVESDQRPRTPQPSIAMHRHGTLRPLGYLQKLVSYFSAWCLCEDKQKR